MIATFIDGSKVYSTIVPFGVLEALSWTIAGIPTMLGKGKNLMNETGNKTAMAAFDFVIR